MIFSIFILNNSLFLLQHLGSLVQRIEQAFPKRFLIFAR
jgi:hypothetical protein